MTVQKHVARLLVGLALLAVGGGALARPVVLELFTSNSCSSCPPAYVLLDRLQAADGAKLIRLDEHVDYWNQLDWVDRYSSAAFTRRQKIYARAVFGPDKIYTPQLVVDGRREALGSDERAARAAIRAAAARRAWPVSLQTRWPGGHKLTVDITVAAPAAAHPARVWLALTQDHVVSHVGAGENRGRTLRENGVVRRLKPVGRIAATTRGQEFHARLDLPRRAARRDLAVVAFVQRPDTYAIVGAARRRLR